MTKVPAILDALFLHEKELRGFLLRRLRCRQQVADLFQDLAERLLRRPVADCGNPRAYLFQAASNALIDYRRTERCRRRHAEEALWDADLELDTRSPERQLLAHETIALIEAALAELPPLTRQIFYLYRLEGLSQVAIAEQLSISRSTVERRLDAAIARWQKRLADAEAR
jgi:RNA polymerase sigma-70 factor (ECF subfamily)